MPTYTIKAVNLSSDPKNFLLFTSPSTVGVKKSYTNVWMKSPSVKNTEHATFIFKSDDFAVCGTTGQALKEGMVVTTGDSQAVTVTGSSPGTKAIVNVVDDVPGFTEAAGTTSLDQQFEIVVGSYTSTSNIYCGYGKYHSESQVVPVTVWDAATNATYGIKPKPYSIGTGDFEEGTTFDDTTIGEIGAIDFTSTSNDETVATITLNSDNTYSAPVFSK